MNSSFRLLLAALALTALLAACGGNGPPNNVLAPTGLVVEARDGAALVSWQGAAQAQLAGYVVSVHVSSGALLKSVDVPKDQTTVLITGLTNGVVYSFRVSAELVSGARSPEAGPVLATPHQASAPPATPQGLDAAAQDGQVLLTWSPNTEPDLAGYTVHFGVAGGPLAGQLKVGRATASALITGLTNGASYQFQLEARNAADQASARTAPVTAVPQANLSAPRVLSVAVTGYDQSTQVRQGAGPIELVITGERLQDLTQARVLGAFELTVLEATGNSARLSGVVPHGLETGLRTLLVAAPGGEHAVANAVEITKIVAAQTPGLNPSDTTGTGTPNRPFLTLTKALSVAGDGDTVLLGAGIYAAGESWPSGGTTPTPNVPAGVTIEGMSSDRGAVLLDGRGAASTDGLAFAGSVTVRNLSLRGFRYAMYVMAGTPELRQGQVTVENVAAFDNLAGLWAQSADTLAVSGSAFRNNSVGSAGGWGMLIQGVRTTSVKDTQIIGNYVGLRLTTTASGAPSSASLDGLTVTTNASHGVRVTNVSTTISGSQVASNSGDGLRFEGSPPSIGVGSGTVLKQNSGVQLVDLRDAYQGTFRVSRYALADAGVTVGTYMGPAQKDNAFRIVNAGNGFIVE